MPVRLSPTQFTTVIQPWAEVAEPIHRRLARLIDAEPGQEVLWIGCGAGRPVLWWTKRFETHVEGIDPDPKAIDAAEAAARETGLSRYSTFQTAMPTNLPHEAEVFDVTCADLLHLLGVDGSQVLQEAARVARPMSTVAALVPCWLSVPDPNDASLLASFGLVPQLLVEWKSAFRLAGIVEITVEDSALDGKWIAQGGFGTLVRGWWAARWAGVTSVLSPEFKALRAMAQGRVLGLSIIKGIRWPHE